jgi:hypothetical protein
VAADSGVPESKPPPVSGTELLPPPELPPPLPPLLFPLAAVFSAIARESTSRQSPYSSASVGISFCAARSSDAV